MKVATIDLKGKAYATVPTRIKEFREQNPNGEIKTSPEILTDGQVLFKAFILKDKSNPTSASATGHAIGKLSGDKAFEKLETIAIGRALAILGYLSSGDIASSEEMERFEEFRTKEKENALSALKSCETIDKLKETFKSLGSLMADNDIIKTKDEMKAKLSK